MRWAPALFYPSPLRPSALPGDPFQSLFAGLSEQHNSLADSSLPFTDSRLTPHYPAKSPLDDVLRLVTPGSDEFVTEKYAAEINSLLDEWRRGIAETSPDLISHRQSYGRVDQSGFADSDSGNQASIGR